MRCVRPGDLFDPNPPHYFRIHVSFFIDQCAKLEQEVAVKACDSTGAIGVGLLGGAENTVAVRATS